MKEEIYIKVGNGVNNHTEYTAKNIIPIKMNLCCDARKSNCKYFIQVYINNEDISFSQGFCGFDFRKF